MATLWSNENESKCKEDFATTSVQEIFFEEELVVIKIMITLKVVESESKYGEFLKAIFFSEY